MTHNRGAMVSFYFWSQGITCITDNRAVKQTAAAPGESWEPEMRSMYVHVNNTPGCFFTERSWIIFVNVQTVVVICSSR